MSTSRIGEVQAKSELIEELRDFLTEKLGELRPLLATSPSGGTFNFVDQV